MWTLKWCKTVIGQKNIRYGCYKREYTLKHKVGGSIRIVSTSCSSVDIKLALPTVLIHLPIRQFLRGISFFFLYGLRMELKHTYHFLQVKLNRKVGSSFSKKVSSKFQIQRIWSMPISLLWLGKRGDKQNRKIWRRKLYLFSFTYTFSFCFVFLCNFFLRI